MDVKGGYNDVAWAKPIEPDAAQQATSNFEANITLAAYTILNLGCDPKWVGRQLVKMGAAAMGGGLKVMDKVLSEMEKAPEGHPAKPSVSLRRSEPDATLITMGGYRSKKVGLMLFRQSLAIGALGVIKGEQDEPGAECDDPNCPIHGQQQRSGTGVVKVGSLEELKELFAGMVPPKNPKDLN